jgi:serine O-acetyltransferase
MKYSFKQFSVEIRGDLSTEPFNLKTFVKAYYFSPRFRVLLNHRLGKFFWSSTLKPIRFIGIMYKMILVGKRSCDISYNARIGANLKLPHPIGIVIGDGVVIKNNVMIFQHVTLGSHGKKGEKLRYPTIESGVRIYAGAVIIGGVTIGENAVIGANTVVNVDVPSRATAVGNPCKILVKA